MFFILLGILLLLVGVWQIKRGISLLRKADQMQPNLDVFAGDYKESPFCCRSIVHILGPSACCQCFRCRSDRGEAVTEQSQTLAESIKEQAMQAWKGAM